ncbi:hypothetical protein NA57DRAFT_59797 [Rhizodiscina lignyota]|uniref:Uncharacterized protein n=1 Tax=Rhizodiscina lignyota TaxID=1504668 RepID=A0A9P4I4L9_9PEZI|nr:hypothetical protein NA57DRAFT_59797 [Rhizodiscina lignyota]
MAKQNQIPHYMRATKASAARSLHNPSSPPQPGPSKSGIDPKAASGSHSARRSPIMEAEFHTCEERRLMGLDPLVPRSNPKPKVHWPAKEVVKGVRVIPYTWLPEWNGGPSCMSAGTSNFRDRTNLTTPGTRGGIRANRCSSPRALGKDDASPGAGILLSHQCPRQCRVFRQEFTYGSAPVQTCSGSGSPPQHTLPASHFNLFWNSWDIMLTCQQIGFFTDTSGSFRHIFLLPGVLQVHLSARFFKILFGLRVPPEEVEAEDSS